MDPIHFYTSALSTAQFLAKQEPNGSAFVIGEIGLLQALKDINYKITDENPDYGILLVTRNGQDIVLLKDCSYHW